MEAAKLAYFIVLPIVVFVVLTWIRRRGPASDHSAALALVTGDVLVRGWSHDQLVAILEAFIELYAIDASIVRDEPAQHGWTRISFTEPVDSSHLLFLVNYLHYPMDMEVDRASPVAVGRFMTVEGCGPAGAPTGLQAKAYVPLNDEEHDLVFVTLADGTTYRVSFTDMTWVVQRDDRMSAEVRAVPFGVGEA